ncbi:MAG: HlyD family efflux transporter periplasmic adaptor subunit [Eubacteriales bacterium]|nr:HlyD family efflux transporter periplasmic adaptor subunit [Eubacteriales bacterium]
MKRKRFIKWLGLFFGAMLVFTVLSRAADSMNTARVRVSRMQNQIITHKVRGSGKVEGTRELAVFAEDGQRVEQILVKEGQSVKKDQTLLKLSLDVLLESVEKKEDELEELNLRVQDLKSADSVNQTKRSMELSRAQTNYNIAAGNGDYNVQAAQNELNLARQRLDDYYDSLGFTSEPGTSAEEQALQDDIRAKQEALNQAVMNRNQAVLEAQRGIEDASLGEATDGSLKNTQRQIETVQKELAKLQEILEHQGEIKAPADGVIKSVSVVTGGQTGQDAAMVLYELSGELRMTASVSEDDMKYVEIGGNAEVKGSSGTESVDARIESVSEDNTDPDIRILTLVLPEDSLSIGESAEFTISRDEGPYNTCIPLSALYGENGKEYVLVMDTQDSVLGEVQVLRKVSVTVQDKNDSSAALAPGALAGDQQVVTEADRSVEEGSRVRLQES